MKAAWITIGALAAAGCVLSVVATIPSVAAQNWTGAAGSIATLLSILLAVVSIFYTYRTNEDTKRLLSDIREQNESMVERINLELRKGNFGRQNIESLEEKFAREDNAVKRC